MPAAHGRYVEHPGPIQVSAGGARALARRLWHGRMPAPARLQQQASELAAAVPTAPGRVHSLGPFEDQSGDLALRAALPPSLAALLRPQFEWYGCRGAGFHTDAHYDGVLFGAWCLAGPNRTIVFARSGLRLACAAGDLVVFDPFEPHAVLDAGRPHYRREHYLDAPASVLLAFELQLAGSLRKQFGIAEPAPGALTISSATVVNAETGAIG
jgi:hypothetical protein